jgi:hypothetical protein
MTERTVSGASLTTDNAVAQAAERLTLAARTGVPTAPVRDVLGSTDVALAYQVQNALTAARKERQLRGAEPFDVACRPVAAGRADVEVASGRLVPSARTDPGPGPRPGPRDRQGRPVGRVAVPRQIAPRRLRRGKPARGARDHGRPR